MINLDTDILLRLMNRDREVMSFFVKYLEKGESFVTSSVSWYSLLTGPIDHDEIRHVRDLLAKAPISLDETLVADAAALFHGIEGTSKSRNSALIAAVAIAHGGKLVTGNTADFHDFESHGLEVIEL